MSTYKQVKNIFLLFINMENESLRKLIRETLENEGDFLFETHSDESVDNIETEMLKPWLIYYKEFGTEGYNTIASIHRTAFNSKLTHTERLNAIILSVTKYKDKIHSIFVPNLNEKKDN